MVPTRRRATRLWGAIRARLGRAYLRLTGWTVVGSLPPVPKYVIVAAPHTSNWDFPIFLAMAWALGLRPRFIAKHQLFRPPLGWFFRRVGGIPVHRDRDENIVAQVADVIRRADRIALGLAPEGTRQRVDAWKSGFYHIAREADVPLVLAFLDYPSKRGGAGPLLYLTGDVEVDMAIIAEFYADKRGRHPEQFGEVRLGPPTD